MNFQEKQEAFQKELKKNLELLDSSIENLKYSLEKCKKIKKTSKYSKKELESMEALTSRFSRTSDLFTQKILKSFFLILKENLPTLIDKANFLEKLRILNSANELLEIREIRNIISHEYAGNNFQEVYETSLKSTPKLLEIIRNFKDYLNSNKNL